MKLSKIEVNLKWEVGGRDPRVFMILGLMVAGATPRETFGSFPAKLAPPCPPKFNFTLLNAPSEF
jgi:hypothetical protein